MNYKLVLAITTYNRINRLKVLIDSFLQYKSNQDWTLIIADDNSNDGTIEYLKNLEIPNVKIQLIKNNRKGVHYQFNTIIEALKKINFDYCFKCDDDIRFINKDWSTHYINGIIKSGYEHLCHYDVNWRKNKNLTPPIRTDVLVGHCKPKDVQGAFFTITKNIIKDVGFMDVKNFGYRGVGHIDYTMRACRAGYNHFEHPFDVKNSDQYITHQTENYQSALSINLQKGLENEPEIIKKYKIIHENRMYIANNYEIKSLNNELKILYLNKRIIDLEKEINHYKGRKLKWLSYLSKIKKLMKKIFFIK